MKTVIAGGLLVAASYVWLAVSVSAGESPYGYSPEAPWHDAGGNLGFWLYHLFTSLAHVVLAVGVALWLSGRRGSR